MTFDFTGKTAVITGGGQGIGRIIAQSFAKSRANVVAADIDKDAAEENIVMIKDLGYTGIAVKADVSKENDCKHIFDCAVSAFGRVDILVNNAGIGGAGIFDTNMDMFDRVISTNLRGSFMCSKFASQHMIKAGGGAIINIASTRAYMSEKNTEAYSASKGGILALTHALAISLGDYGIRVNSISPGWIDVSHLKKGNSPPDILSEADNKQHPVGRVGKAEDIADACLYLASDHAGFITGQDIIIDGGMTVKMIYV